ncbi:succinate dehydrogenase iron-sulfur subunit [bacterium]|nr:succinate dehydrogenase iron-sulfur subunit [bacterium]
MPPATVSLRIKRQEGPNAAPRWEEFKVPYSKGMNIIMCLMEIQRNPVNASGQKTTPVIWEAVCLEQVCGSCSMVINGKPQQACASLVQNLAPNGETITIEPMGTFPIVRDLVVDRQRMFDALKKVHAWIDIDGTHDLGPGPRQSPETQEVTYALSRCMTCGVCLEACPNVNERSPFMGPAAVSQVRLFNLHPSGSMHKAERLDALNDIGGVNDCGNSQNCVRACPKGIPLTESLAAMKRDTTVHGLLGFLQLP